MATDWAFPVMVLAVMVPQVVTHPQCLDFRPPFQARSRLRLCAGYSDFGCCTVQDDRQLRQRYRNIRSLLSASDWNRCRDYVRDLLCQSCSPYAAHIFDAERTMRAKSFPGLCRGYCLRFVSTCGDVIPLLDPSFTGSRLLLRLRAFCRRVALTDRDYCYPDLLTSPSLIGQLQQQKETTEGCLCLEPIVENVTSPVYARHSGDGTGRMFVAEQPGVIRILYPGEKRLLPTPFLDISSRVGVSWSAGDERGFLGVAFHPRFAQNGRFFVYYTTEISEYQEDEALWEESEELGMWNLDHKVRLSEMRVSSSNPDQADPDFERVLLEIGEPYANHNGGELLFLADGYLYVSVGDGGGGGDPYNLAQNKRSLLGKILRLDVDSNLNLPYTIPADNPFVGEEDTRPEIFALGVRNIWRCGVDPGDRRTGDGAGRVLCGDVGQNAHEEVDLLRAGANYGWSAKEGFACYDDNMCDMHIENEELPVHSYPHSVGKSVTGGHFYRGCESPALNGQYIYGDYVTGRLFSLEERSDRSWRNKNLTMCGVDVCFNGLTSDYDVHILSFGQDEHGEVYMLTSPSSRPRRADGRIFKVVDPLRRGDPSDCPSAGQRARVLVSPTLPPRNTPRPRSTPPPRNTPRPRNTSQPRNTPRPTEGDVEPAQAPTIQQIRVRVCGVTPSFFCRYLLDRENEQDNNE